MSVNEIRGINRRAITKAIIIALLNILCGLRDLTEASVFVARPGIFEGGERERAVGRSGLFRLRTCRTRLFG